MDDDDGLREVLADALSLENIEVVQARSGPEALGALDAGLRPSAVLLDLLMPVMSGEQLLRILRQRPATRSLPVIAMSASPERLARIADVDARMQKPFDLDELLRTLARLCATAEDHDHLLGHAIDGERRTQ